MSKVQSPKSTLGNGRWALDVELGQQDQMTLDKDTVGLQDTVGLRAGEELNLSALDDYLRQHLAASDFDPTTSLELEQFPGGHSNLTYLIRYGNNEFVLRRPPIGPVAPTAHDMPREHHVLSVIHPHFPLAPEPLLLCEDADVIGAPFYLMERRQV